MMIRYGTEFDRIVDAMNQVFGWNYKACMKGFYYLNPEKTCGAWFPKLVVLDEGEERPGDQWKKWKNRMSNDEETIFMLNSDDPSRMSLIDPNYPVHLTFAKKPGGRYFFYGAYKITRLDPVLGYVFTRIEKDVDTSKYF